MAWYLVKHRGNFTFTLIQFYYKNSVENTAPPKKPTAPPPGGEPHTLEITDLHNKIELSFLHFKICSIKY
jgi:hypothetical protein